MSTTLKKTLADRFGEDINIIDERDLTIEVHPEKLITIMTALRDEAPFQFNQLMDVCGVDYRDYGISEWRTEETTATGFSRAADRHQSKEITWDKPRFASTYHLLSLPLNHRLRVRVFIDETGLKVPSVCDIWPAANWFEREAFDMFGIEYVDHPDLRRILTDYGFKGHPFRKDFPLIGQVELRYDATQKRCVYEPVSIQPRVLTPKVIREDNRYLDPDAIS